MLLENAQVEFDLGSEDIIARHGSVAGSAFRIGRRGYRVVVLPPATETLTARTVERLEHFLAGGGKVISCGADVHRVDGRLSDRVLPLTRRRGFRKNGMERNPWDSAVQFRDEFISRSLPEGSGFVATYRFTIQDRVPARLEAVIERSDLCPIECNGKSVTAAQDSWWLDPSFGKIDITSAYRVGENVLELRASPFTIYHEPEPVALLGDFSLRPMEKGGQIVPEVSSSRFPSFRLLKKMVGTNNDSPPTGRVSVQSVAGPLRRARGK